MRIKSNDRHYHKTETAAGAGVYEIMAMWLCGKEGINQQFSFLSPCFPSIHKCLHTGICIPLPSLIS